jgi:hypothetical protein
VSGNGKIPFLAGDYTFTRRNEMLNARIRSGAGVETILFKKVVFEERRPCADMGLCLKRALAWLAGRGEEADGEK